ncbi:MAG: type II toxin-antitoxin system HicB family antitoxin [Armatimonadota bacterium]|nr:type II toxin-antitoxin system HicB family antitoxin [Armatimonadota bacterium]
MDYTVLVHTAEEGGYWTEVPSLPGCFSQGETVEEALANTKEAIESHIEALREDGQQVAGDEGLLIGRVKIAA